MKTNKYLNILLIAVILLISACGSNDPTPVTPTTKPPVVVPPVAVVLPTVTISPAIAVTYTSATITVNVTDQGSSVVTSRGIIFGVVGSTTSPTQTVDGSGVGGFTHIINSALSPATTYFVRGYATNSGGTSVSSDITFTTLATSLATVTTNSTVSLVKSTTASSGGNVTNDGGALVSARGIVWNTATAPTVSVTTKTTDGAGPGPFVSSMTNLTPTTTYYVRAYATNSVGTAYGNEISFTTNALQIGEAYQGGIIGYILQPGDLGYDANVKHGIVVALTDINTGVLIDPSNPYGGYKNPIWGCIGTLLTGANGSGMQNTLDIVAGCNTPLIAARLCNDLVSGGYSDWYLPSKDELYKISLNITTITATGLTSIVGTANYQSSTQTDATYAMTVQLSSGAINYVPKDFLLLTRPFRNF